LEVSIQSCSDPQPEVHTIQLIDDGITITPGTAKQIQSPYPIVYKRYTVPETVCTGPSLDELAKKEAEDTTSVKPFEGNKSLGESFIVVEQIDKVYPDESWKREATFYNIMMVQVRVQNTSHHDEPVFVTKVESEYQDKQGNWKPTTHSGIGNKNGYYNFTWTRSPFNIPFSKKDSALSALSAEIPIVNYLQADKNRRIHHSLPYPLPVRWTLTDNAGKTTKLNVLCYHEAKLSPASRAQKEKDAGFGFDAWMQCDDLNALHRVWLGLKHKIEENSFFLSTQGTSMNLTQDSLQRAVWNALQDTKKSDGKFTEQLLEFPSRASGVEWFIEIRVMIDLENKHPYALHVTGKSTTSTIEAYKLLPSEL